MTPEPVFLTAEQVSLLSTLQARRASASIAYQQRIADLNEFEQTFCSWVLGLHGIKQGQYDLDLASRQLIPKKEGSPNGKD